MSRSWVLALGASLLMTACVAADSADGGASGADVKDAAVDGATPSGDAASDAGAPFADAPGGEDTAGFDASADAAADPPYCMLAAAAEGVGSGAGCGDNAWRCSKGQGCRAGACAPCEAAADCREMEGCAGGICGRCEADAACGPSAMCRNGFCVPSALPVWELTVAPEDWVRFWADPLAKNEVPCTLVVDGTPYGGCTVRLRGGTSIEFPKRSFRVEIDDELPTPGFSHRINLRAEYNDRSYMRNALALYTFSRLSHMPTPRTRYVSVVLNGEPYGLMVEVERVGDPLLERWGRATDTAFYEADPGSGLTGQGACAMVPLPDPALYAEAYDQKGKSDPDNAALRELVEDVVWKDHEDRLATGGADASRIRGAVHTDLYVDYLALMGLLQAQDHVRKNYYFSRQSGPDGALWEVHPWDLDLSFGCTWTESHETYCRDFTTDGGLDVGVAPSGIAIGYPVEAYYNLLIDLVLRDPQHLARFRGRLCAMIDDPLWTDDLANLSLALEEALAPAVAADASDRIDSVAEFHADAASLRAFLAARADFVRGQIDCGRCTE